MVFKHVKTHIDSQDIALVVRACLLEVPRVAVQMRMRKRAVRACFDPRPACVFSEDEIESMSDRIIDAPSSSVSRVERAELLESLKRKLQEGPRTTPSQLDYSRHPSIIWKYILWLPSPATLTRQVPECSCTVSILVHDIIKKFD